MCAGACLHLNPHVFLFEGFLFLFFFSWLPVGYISAVQSLCPPSSFSFSAVVYFSFPCLDVAWNCHREERDLLCEPCVTADAHRHELVEGVGGVLNSGASFANLVPFQFAVRTLDWQSVSIHDIESHLQLTFEYCLFGKDFRLHNYPSGDIGILRPLYFIKYVRNTC